METRKKKLRYSSILLGLLALLLVPRLVGISRFMTIDEPAWLLFASNFYLALNKGDFERTVIDYGVTTLWVITLAFLSYFPRFPQVAKYTDKYWVVDRLFQKFKKSPLTLLVNARLISIMAICATLLLSFGLLDMLMGTLTALVVTLMVAFDPFFLGHSRLLNHEGLMVTMVLVAILAALVFLHLRRQTRYLLLSGAAAGVALLTKSPAIVLLPMVGLMFLVRYLQEARGNPGKLRSLASYGGNLLAWLAVLCLVYFVLWPGMWVAPGKMLFEVFGNALSNAFQGGRLAYTQELNLQRFGLDFSGVWLYSKVALLKTTPITWLGVGLALAGMAVRKEPRMSSTARLVAAYFGLLAVGFVLLFGIAQGRNHDHYILTSFVGLDGIAGIGIAWSCQWLAARWAALRGRLAQGALLAVLILLHGAGALPQYPYYYTYTNPIARMLAPSLQDPEPGYGEGLDQAGRYLAEKPGAQQGKAMSWFAAGSFSYFYPGTTYNLLLQETIPTDYVQRMRDSDYLVIYSVFQKPNHMPARLMDALQSIPPEHTITINGQEYVEIYRVKDFSNAFFESILH